MSGGRASLPAGLLRGSRSKSYGSLVRSPLCPVRQRLIEHKLQPGDTLQGLALKYEVSMEQLKRVNRLYTNDSIFLKSSLLIPVMSDLDDSSNGMDLAKHDNKRDDAGCTSSQNGHRGSSPETKQDDGKETASDLTPVDFLKRLDDLISQSKQAAVKGCQEAEKRLAVLEAACTSTASDWQPLRRSQSVISSSRLEQQSAHGAVPLTITKLTKNLRDQEDDIFEL